MTDASVQITDTATPDLARIRGQVTKPRPLMAAAGKRVEKELRGHFQEKDAEGNKKGWPARSHFWNRTVRQATAFTAATDTSAEVTIGSPEFVHRLRGGVVRAVRGKFLAIPLVSAAKAAGSPREWDDRGALVPVRLPRGLYLFRRLGKTRKGKGNFLAYYKLVRSVTHKPDPSALPSDAYLGAAIDDEALKYFNRELAK